MTLDLRILALSKLGDRIRELSTKEKQELAELAILENPWFIGTNVLQALHGIEHFLEREALQKWTSKYDFSQVRTKVIGLVLAGNIPLVGFHDLLCVLLSGHTAKAKLSSKDTSTMKWLISELIAMEPAFQNQIVIETGTLQGSDAFIATGSDNTARHFEYYFGKFPHIIRKNRTSCAILTGDETPQELENLGKDVFSFFGLGCRNVSKVFIPEGYNPAELFKHWSGYSNLIDHHKYANNYDYQKAILLVNQQIFLDSGYILLQENERLVSPISVLYYEYYQDASTLQKRISSIQDKLQCIVGNVDPATVPFGKAQYPDVWDFADGIDTLKFLTSLR
jgi:hypothetical protein